VLLVRDGLESRWAAPNATGPLDPPTTKEGVDRTSATRPTADRRLLLTLDRGLGDIRAYPPGTHAGIVMVRLDDQSPRAIRDAIERISVTVDFADLRGCVAVWREDELRVRRPHP
jgi:hypothetical protein